MERSEGTTYDLMPGYGKTYEKGYLNLTRDGKKVDAVLMINWRETFLEMGEAGFLRGSALDLYKGILEADKHRVRWL